MLHLQLCFKNAPKTKLAIVNLLFQLLVFAKNGRWTTNNDVCFNPLSLIGHDIIEFVWYFAFFKTKHTNMTIFTFRDRIKL